MQPSEFLSLIGAPWAAYHDHPNPETARDMAQIRPQGNARHIADVCEIYGCTFEYDGDDTIGRAQRARRDLIAKAPDLYAYMARMAETGDTEARMLLKSIHGEPL